MVRIGLVTGAMGESMMGIFPAHGHASHNPISGMGLDGVESSKVKNELGQASGPQPFLRLSVMVAVSRIKAAISSSIDAVCDGDGRDRLGVGWQGA